jgi:parallel beta-helix repeat protein
MTSDELIQRFKSYPYESAVFQRNCVVWAHRMLRESNIISRANPQAGSVVSIHEAEQLLVRDWRLGNVSPEQAISARAAERGCKAFLQQLGYEVIEASLGQVLEKYDIRVPDLEFEPEAWKTYDLYAAKHNRHTLQVDVKSARRNDRGVYSRFFVKSYKQTLSENVKYFAVLMPNLREANSSTPAVIMGMTSLDTIQSLRKYANQLTGFLTVDFKAPGREYGDFIPPYIFDFDAPLDFYREQRLVCEQVRSLTDAQLSELLSLQGDAALPILLASRRSLPGELMARLEDWEREFVQGIIDLPVSERISLPYLFVYLLLFFVRTVNRQIPPNLPSQWVRWIYGSGNPERLCPLGIFDPLNIIRDFVNALNILYMNLQKGTLRYRSFDFRGPGLLRGTTENGSTHTLLAYCGQCGQRPLIWGREETCHRCGYLVCSESECHFCKRDCLGYDRLSLSRLRDHSQAHKVNAEWKIQQTLTRNSVVLQLDATADIENLSLVAEGGVLRLRFLVKFPRKTIDHVIRIYDKKEQTSSRSVADEDLGVRVDICNNYRIVRDREYPIKVSITAENRLEFFAPRIVELPEIEVQWLCSIGKEAHSEVVCGARNLVPASVLLEQVPEHFDLKQAIAEAEPRDIILIPEGEYILDEPLRIDKPLLLLGSGMERTVLVNNTEDAGVYVDLPASQEVTNVVQFYGITIRSNREDSACGMRVLNGTAYADYCRFEKSGEVGVEVKNHAKFVAKECEFTKHSKDGVTVRDQSSAEIEDSLSASNGRHGVFATDSSKLFARNNTCEGNKDSGIALFGSAQGELESNTCRNNGYHGIVAHEQSHLVARNNTCEGNKQVGIALFGSAQGELESNTCRNNEKQGIYAQDQSRLVARNNTCEGNKQGGIGLFGSAQGELQGNICRNNEKQGIYAQDQSRLVARNNTCEGNKQAGIALFGSAQGDVSGNACRNNGYHGIAAHEQSHLAARNNTCEGNKQAGIALFGSAQGELESNTCRQNERYGIYAVEQSRLVARNNTCEGNKGTGIALFGSAQGELQGNTCRKNEKHGIYAGEQSRLVARNNTCEGNKDTGIALFGSAQGELQGNTCRKNEKHGIYAGEQSRLVARNNTCEGNKDTGIALFGSAQGELESNTCRQNERYGIYAGEQAHLVARSNTCEGNKRSGITLFGSAQGELESNTCRRNQGRGIYVAESARASERNNTCEENLGDPQQ